MMQMARNLIDPENGFFSGKTHLILDRDTKYTLASRRTLEREGIEMVQLPPRSPNLTAFAERFVRSIKTECLDRMMFFSSAQSQHAIDEYMAHYHEERIHQGGENQLIEGEKSRAGVPHGVCGEVERRRRLGGLLNFHHRAAA